MGGAPPGINVEDPACVEDLVPPGVPEAPHNPDPPRYPAWASVPASGRTAQRGLEGFNLITPLTLYFGYVMFPTLPTRV